MSTSRARLMRAKNDPRKPAGPSKSERTRQAILDVALDFLWSRGHRTVGFMATSDTDWQQRRHAALKESALQWGADLQLLYYCELSTTDWSSGLQFRTIRELESLSRSDHPLVRTALSNIQGQRADILVKLTPVTGAPDCREPLDAIVALTRARQMRVDGIPAA